MEAGGGEQEVDSDAADGAAAGEAVEGKRVKKRVAMFCGYVGSKYRGLQINRTAAGESTSRAPRPPPLPKAGGVPVPPIPAPGVYRHAGARAARQLLSGGVGD